ncbi:hypothetical protein AAF712_014475 [Marasmius tenuissimus]|uniref:Uncharacterized protein n=1 Tax=Marasmius tenuissimus TaxID=585030 RepID=A0ABR2ZCW5_9AGAR
MSPRRRSPSPRRRSPSPRRPTRYFRSNSPYRRRTPPPFDTHSTDRGRSRGFGSPRPRYDGSRDAAGGVIMSEQNFNNTLSTLFQLATATQQALINIPHLQTPAHAQGSVIAPRTFERATSRDNSRVHGLYNRGRSQHSRGGRGGRGFSFHGRGASWSGRGRGPVLSSPLVSRISGPPAMANIPAQKKKARRSLKKKKAEDAPVASSSSTIPVQEDEPKDEFDEYLEEEEEQTATGWGDGGGDEDDSMGGML